MNQTQTYPEAPCLWCGDTLIFAPRREGVVTSFARGPVPNPNRGRVWQHADGAVGRDDHVALPVRS